MNATALRRRWRRKVTDDAVGVLFDGPVVIEACGPASRFENLSPVDFDNAVEEGDCDGLCSVGGTELADGRLDVLVNGSLADMENFSDLPGGLTASRPCQNLHLARSERMGCRRGLGSLESCPNAISPQDRKAVRPCRGQDLGGAARR
jgi:hypothetical protein